MTRVGAVTGHIRSYARYTEVPPSYLACPLMNGQKWSEDANERYLSTSCTSEQRRIATYERRDKAIYSAHPSLVLLQVSVHGVGEVDHLRAGHGRVCGSQEAIRVFLRVVVASQDESSGRLGIERGDDIVEVHVAVGRLLIAGADLHVPVQGAHRVRDVLREVKKRGF